MKKNTTNFPTPSFRGIPGVVDNVTTTVEDDPSIAQDDKPSTTCDNDEAKIDPDRDEEIH